MELSKLTAKKINSAEVLYDKGNQRFKLLSLPERHYFYEHFFAQDNIHLTRKKEGDIIEYIENRPLIIVSSSSYSPDEDFEILVKACDVLEEKISQMRDIYPHLVFVLTGRGPLRDHFQDIFARKNYKKLTVIMRWLEPDDYPKLLGAADFGICFHYSSSGLDLPMKVVDMFATQLPVLAIEYKR